MNTTTPKLTVVCRCGKETTSKPAKDGSPKTPMGWKKINGEWLCRKCKVAQYYTRGYRFEILGHADKTDEREFHEFRRQCSAASLESARYGNWLVRELLKIDPCAEAGYKYERREDGKSTKLPKLPECDAYAPIKAGIFPCLAGASAVALAKMVRQWYESRRYESLVSCSRSVESYRFGRLPVEIPRQGWSIRRGEDNQLAIKTQAGPGKSWLVAIRGEGRALAAIKACISGDGIPLALKIVRQTKINRDGSKTKAWFFRISIMLRRVEPKRRKSHQEITLTLGHDPGMLLFGSLENSEEVFEWHGQTLRSMIVGGDKSDRAHQADIARMFGIWSKRKIARWSQDRTAKCEARQRKIKNQLKLVAASLVRWCVGQGVTSVDYETVDRGFVPHFPWRMLRDDIQFALEREGIALHVLSAEATNAS